MPVIDLDDALSNLLPFDYRIKLGGVEYALRPPTLHDLSLLANFKALGVGEAAKAVANLFVGPGRPDVGALEPMALFGLATAIGEAFKAHVEGNSQALATRVRASLGPNAGAKGSTSGK